MVEINEYEKQAEDFLKETGTTFEIKFVKYDKYFPKDSDKRDIYEFTLSRGSRKYTALFGNSIFHSGVKVFLANRKNPIDVTDKLNTLQLKDARSGKRPSFAVNNPLDFPLDFPLVRTDRVTIPEAPTAYDVLACLTKYDPGTFENFCSDFGYDDDSITAHRTYEAVIKEWQGTQALFTDAELDQLQEIQ